MKHFSNDGCNKQPKYDEHGFGVHLDDDHDSMKEYEINIGGPHYEPDSDDWYEGTIKHFSDY